MHAIGTWMGGFATQLDDGRTHTVRVDLPVEEGGASSGTSALELLILALAGCVTTIFALVARRRRIGLQHLAIALEAERPARAPTVTRVRGTLRVATRNAPEEVETALRLTLRSCPVGVLFERAGIPVEIRSIVVDPRRESGGGLPSGTAGADSPATPGAPDVPPSPRP
jgi:putative redox protein